MNQIFFEEIYKKATWGLAETGWRHAEIAGCALTFPWLPKTHIFVEDVGFQEWQKRGIDLWYRYGNTNCCGMHLRTPLMKSGSMMSEGLRHILSFKSDVPSYTDEIRDSKFCLHLHLDDPGGHRFADALAALCIPVIISDGHFPHWSPFPDVFRYEDFTLRLEEMAFVKNPSFLEGAVRFALRDQARLRRMFETLLLARRAMIAYHPNSMLANYFFSSVEKRCLTS